MPAGGASHWDAADYARAGAFVPALGQPALELLDPQPGERILDIGCGDGALTASIAAAGAQVVGIDANAPLLAVAARRGIETFLCHAEAMSFSSEFDAAFSNAALHWMGAHKDLVATRIYAALKPGGRFVGELGGEGNLAGLLAALEEEATLRGYEIGEGAANWYPDPESFASTYAHAGFEAVRAELIDRPTPLGPEGVPGWIRTFRTGWLEAIGMPPAERDDYGAAVAARWGRPDADYKRLRFTMRKPD